MRRFRLALPSPRPRTSLMSGLLSLALIVAMACNEQPPGEDPGTPTDPDPNSPANLRVQVNTTGGDPDLDGYTVLVDGLPKGTTSNVILIEGLTPGTHRVELQGIASNCLLAGSPVREVVLISSSAFWVGFDVTCYTTGIEVVTTTNGIDFGTGYSVNLQNLGDQLIGLNATSLISRLTPNRYTVTLKLDPALTNCQVGGAGASREVEVANRTVVPVSFSVMCVARFGIIQVLLKATGPDADPGSYFASIDDGPPRRILSSGTANFDSIPGGDHTVRVSGGSENCTLTGSAQTLASIPVGGLGRPSVLVSFSATCVEIARRIAFTLYSYGAPHWGYDPIVSLTTESGGTPIELAGGMSPAWSPNGLRLAFVRVSGGCYYGCEPTGIAVINRDGSGIVQLTGNSHDYEPTWSPNGAKIAFQRNDNIMVMNADGSSQVALVNYPGGGIDAPDWSPDGSRLAFSCDQFPFPGSTICLVNADGSGLVQVPIPMVSSFQPAWHPDGTRLAFSARRDFGNGFDIAVINIDGTGMTRLTAGDSPAWSSDGSRIYFVREGGLYSIKPDGSDLRLTLATAGGWNFAPDLRP